MKLNLNNNQLRALGNALHHYVFFATHKGEVCGLPKDDIDYKPLEFIYNEILKHHKTKKTQSNSASAPRSK